MMNIISQIDQLQYNCNVILNNVIAACLFPAGARENSDRAPLLCQMLATPVCIFDATQEQLQQYEMPKMASDGSVFWVHASEVEQLCNTYFKEISTYKSHTSVIDIVEKEVCSWFEDVIEQKYNKVAQATIDFKNTIASTSLSGPYAQQVKKSLLDVPDEIKISWNKWVRQCLDHMAEDIYKAPIQSNFMRPLLFEHISTTVDALYAYSQKDLNTLIDCPRTPQNEALSCMAVLDKYPTREEGQNEDRATRSRLNKEFNEHRLQIIIADLPAYANGSLDPEYTVEILSGIVESRLHDWVDDNVIQMKVKSIWQMKPKADDIVSFLLENGESQPWCSALVDVALKEYTRSGQSVPLQWIERLTKKHPQLLKKCDLTQEMTLEALGKMNHLNDVTSLKNILKQKTNNTVVVGNFSAPKKR